MGKAIRQSAQIAAVSGVKNELYRRAYRKIDRSIKSGFHIEAIALLESIMCDRLESLLERVSGDYIAVSTLGQLLEKLRPHQVIPRELEDEIRAWNRQRGLVIHEIVKVTLTASTSWNERISFARITALEGVVLLKKVRKITDARVPKFEDVGSR